MSSGTSTIETGATLVTLINVFTVERENQERLIEVLVEATETTMKGIDGFISANIHKSLDGERVTNYAQWRSRAAFEAMLKNPEAQKHMAPILKIAKSEPHLYEVVDVHHS
ncbi:MAG TPA: antibiotic biosynthesis monooxygenase family protein [Steroidobacteraceae bacterium]|jgi:quinol monooxygenase YgiN|nr:antibiotic biosynthesis monooxygenase family protein [Steroidobacteraceae bacterium]